MMVWRVAGLAVGWGVALLWATRGGGGCAGCRDCLICAGRRRAGVADALSVIVPARNEGQGVGAGLRSLLASKGVELEVIAVDDRSTDETGLVMDALEREPREGGVRYVVEHVQELPPGWLGKPHAMARGAALATGEWLLFTDGDVVFAEETLARALAWHRA